MSRSIRLIVVALAFALLLFGTVLVFQVFDRTSHSASDTLRPFIITMFPVWLVAIAGAWALLRTPSPASDAWSSDEMSEVPPLP